MSLTDRIATHISLLSATLEQAQRPLLLTHLNPDGDALGSLLGMWHILRAMGKQVSALAWPTLPAFAHELPGGAEIQIYAAGNPLPEHDLLLMVDTSDRGRIGQILVDHPQLFEQQPLIMIDHHQTARAEGLVAIIEPTMASCAELVYEVAQALGTPLPPDAATCLLLGIMSDTQSFQTSSTDAHSLRTAAALIEAGANQRLAARAPSSLRFSDLQLAGLALGRLQRDGGMMWTVITQAMYRAIGFGEEGGDEVINLMRRVADVQVYALLKERADGMVKISLRANPGIDVAEITRQWGGGGHVLAAGATLPMGLAAAEAAVLAALRAALAARSAE